MVHLTPIEKDFNWRCTVEKEVKEAKTFEKRWGWINREILEMEKKLNEMSKKSEYLKEVFKEEEVDKRDIRPVPESTNHMYGWIANKEEFQYKIPDRSKNLPLPPIYKLM